jgi:hypothetical protein
VSILSLDEAKSYLHFDDDYIDEDVDIQSFIDAAEMYLKNAGCILNPDDQLAKLAIKILVSNWYENRCIEITGPNFNKIKFSLDVIITQLKYCYDEDTAEEGGS